MRDRFSESSATTGMGKMLRDLVQILDKNTERFVLVGAAAAQAHGIGVTTEDSDILMYSRIGKATADFFKKFEHTDRTYRFRHIETREELDVIDPVHNPSIRPRIDRIFSTAIPVHFYGQTLPVATPEALIAMKLAAYSSEDRDEDQRSRDESAILGLLMKGTDPNSVRKQFELPDKEEAKLQELIARLKRKRTESFYKG